MKDKTSEGLFTLIDQFFRIINRFEKERTLFKTVIVSRINAEGCYYGNIDGQEYELPNGTAMTFSPCTRVIVCIPDGDYKQRFIIAVKPRQPH